MGKRGCSLTKISKKLSQILGFQQFLELFFIPGLKSPEKLIFLRNHMQRKLNFF
jgi:hypothetical protein